MRSTGWDGARPLTTLDSLQNQARENVVRSGKTVYFLSLSDVESPLSQCSGYSTPSFVRLTIGNEQRMLGELGAPCENDGE